MNSHEIFEINMVFIIKCEFYIDLKLKKIEILNSLDG